MLSMNATEERPTLVMARTNNTFLEFCEVEEFEPPRRRRFSSSLRRIATDPEIIAEENEAHVAYIKFSCPVEVAPKRNPPLHKVFVGGLSPITDEITLFNFMTQFGPVRNVVVKRNPVTGQSRRYAFVKFYTQPSSWIFDQSWIVDDQPIRISRYEVSADWKNHYYSDQD
jgi:hypothetical protein